jgi:hypothetical protein
MNTGTYLAHELEIVISLHTVAAVEHEEELSWNGLMDEM